MAAAKDKVENTIVKRNDAYTGLLAISFLAMVGATVLLYLEYQNYEGKNPPKAPVVEVPGVQLKLVPNSGGAPPKVVPPDDTMPKEKDKEKDKDMMLLPPAEAKPAGLPTLLPETVQAAPIAEPTQAIEAAPVIGRPEPVVAIPDVPPPGSGIIPAAATEPASPIPPPPIIPMLEPSLTDAPPIPAGRFDPPR